MRFRPEVDVFHEDGGVDQPSGPARTAIYCEWDAGSDKSECLRRIESNHFNEVTAQWPRNHHDKS